jgi:hypothetical protein
VFQPIGVNGGDTSDVIVSTTTANDAFSQGVQLSAVSSPAGLQFTFTPSTIPPPGQGVSKLTISTGNAAPGRYKVIVIASGSGTSAVATFSVTVFCNPPFILGLNEPQNTTIPAGSTTASLTVAPNGSGPLAYQWYQGFTGQVNFPINGATSATLSNATSGIYWVRVTNGCGSADSSAATVFGP